MAVCVSSVPPLLWGRQWARRDPSPAVPGPVPLAGGPRAAAAVRGARGARAHGAAVSPGGLRGALHSGAAEDSHPAAGQRPLAPGDPGAGRPGRGHGGCWSARLKKGLWLSEESTGGPETAVRLKLKLRGDPIRKGQSVKLMDLV